MTKKHYRIAVLGDSASGKTSLIRRFISDEYSDTYDPTIEDRYKKTLMYKGTTAHLQILDTAGKELVYDMMSRYILLADAFMVVYSVGSRKSFKHALHIFSQIAQLRGVDAIARLLVAAMCDSDYREVSPEEGNMLAAQLHCSFAEASAKRNVNVEEVFEELVSQLQYIDTINWSKEHRSDNSMNFLCCFL